MTGRSACASPGLIRNSWLANTAAERAPCRYGSDRHSTWVMIACSPAANRRRSRSRSRQSVSTSSSLHGSSSTASNSSRTACNRAYAAARLHPGSRGEHGGSQRVHHRPDHIFDSTAPPSQLQEQSRAMLAIYISASHDYQRWSRAPATIPEGNDSYRVTASLGSRCRLAMTPHVAACSRSNEAAKVSRQSAHGRRRTRLQRCGSCAADGPDAWPRPSRR